MMADSNEMVIGRGARPVMDCVRELWQYRQLLVMLIKRDVLTKYRQSVFGFAWAFLPPIIQMLVFTVIFGNMAQMGPEGVPYFLFSYAALLPWSAFSRGLTGAAKSVVAGQSMLTKVYFPRLVFPLSGCVGALVDFAVGLVVFFVVVVATGNTLSVKVLMMPIFMLVAMLSALGFGLWISALSVRYRDMLFAAPFFVQLWMYLTPVIYSLDKVPEKYRFLAWSNPMTLVVEGFRWCVIADYPFPEVEHAMIGAGVILFVVVSGVFFFRKSEPYFADCI